MFLRENQAIFRAIKKDRARLYLVLRELAMTDKKINEETIALSSILIMVIIMLSLIWIQGGIN